MSQLRLQFGAALRDRRQAKHLSQSQLAAKASLSLKYVGEVERGEANPSMDALDRLAKALDWNPFSPPIPQASFTPTAAVRRVLIVQLTSMRELANQQADVQEALGWIDRLTTGGGR